MLANLFSGLIINEAAGYNALIYSPSNNCTESPYRLPKSAAEVASFMKEKKIDIFEANRILKVIEDEKLKSILQPGNLLKLGFSLDEL